MVRGSERSERSDCSGARDGCNARACPSAGCRNRRCVIRSTSRSWPNRDGCCTLGEVREVSTGTGVPALQSTASVSNTTLPVYREIAPETQRQAVDLAQVAFARADAALLAWW